MVVLFYCIVGILIPFIGTSLGSFFVFFLKNNINLLVHKLIIGFAAGVMVAASIWSLIMPSVEIAISQNVISWVPCTVGFVLGILFLIFINYVSSLIEKKNRMAVGVCFAGVLSGSSSIFLAEAFVLAIGIAIQNIPEGAIISLPLKFNGNSKVKSFLYGVLSGIVEPVAAFITIMLLNIVVPVLPYLLSFAAGAMFYVVFEELIPEMHMGKKSSFGIIGLSIGFIIMMILDITLG